MAKRRFYLAYGSNMNLRQMGIRCPQAKPVGTVVLEGYELLFRGGNDAAVATIEPRAGAEVPCALWLITPEDEARLDIYEGFPDFYRKELVAVRYGRRSLRAMAYVMNEGRPLGIPSAYYFRAIQEGYRDFGIDTASLYAADKVSSATGTPRGQ